MASRKLLAVCAFAALAGGGAYVFAPGNPASVTSSATTPAKMAAYDRPTPTAAPVFHPYWEHGRAPALAAPAVASPQAPVAAGASEARVTDRAAAPAAPAAAPAEGAQDVGARPPAWPRLDREDAAETVLGARHSASRAGQPLPQSAHAPLVPGAQQVRMHLLATRGR